MSETSNSANDGAQPFIINAQYIKDLSFENPNAPESLLPAESAPDIHLNVNVSAQPVAESTYEVLLEVSAKAELKEKTIFVIELSYAGLFTLEKMSEEAAKKLLLIKGPEVLFPFARQIVSQSVTNGGFPPLMMSPINFAELYEKRVKETH